MIEFDPTTLAVYDQDLAAVVDDLRRVAREHYDDMGDTTFARITTAIHFCANARRVTAGEIMKDMHKGMMDPGLIGMATVLTHLMFTELAKENVS